MNDVVLFPFFIFAVDNSVFDLLDAVRVDSLKAIVPQVRLELDLE